MGSSSSRTRGSAARARATATRCAWPPDSWAGRRSARCSASTASASGVRRRGRPSGSGPCTVGRRRRWRRRSCAGTAAPAGRASRHRARAAGTNTPVAVSVTTVSAEFDPAVVGAQQSGDQQQQRGLPCAVGPQHGQHLSVVQREVELRRRAARRGPAPAAAHIGPASRRVAEAITMTAATTISSSESATAASGSVSRCR